MNILVCIKQVLDDSVKIGYEEARGIFIPESVSKAENAFDTYALEMAAGLRESLGGRITLVSIGELSAKEALKNGLAVGGDEAFLIKADHYQEVDPYSTAKALSEGIRFLEEQRASAFDLIFCGKESTDHMSSQVGSILSCLLGLPLITNTVDLELVDERVIGKHETSDGYDRIEARMPCVVTVGKPSYEPRYATLTSKMEARRKEIREIEGIELEQGSIEVISTKQGPSRKKGMKLNSLSVEEAVFEAVKRMKQAGIV